MTATKSAARRGPPARSEQRAAALLLAPSTVGVVVFFLAPVAVVVWLATQSWDLLGRPTAVGLGNFAALFHDESFGRSLLVTLGSPSSSCRSRWPSASRSARHSPARFRGRRCSGRRS